MPLKLYDHGFKGCLMAAAQRLALVEGCYNSPLIGPGCFDGLGGSNRESRESRGAKKRRFAPNREAFNKIANRPNSYL